MLKSSAVLIALLLIVSCKKSSSSNNSSEANAWVSSIQLYAPGTEERFVDSFTFDGSHRIATYQQFHYDSTYGYPQFATWSAIFSLPAGGSKPPAGYTNDMTGTPESHQLSYDAQGRITEDSSTGASGWVIYFGYPAGKISINAFFNGNVSNSILDTLTMSNGNMVSEVIYQPNTSHTADSLQVTNGQGFSDIANPCYHSALSVSVGPLIHILAIAGYGSDFDPISQKAFNSQSSTCCHLSPITVKYTQYTDSLGRLTQQTDSYGDLLTFRYF